MRIWSFKAFTVGALMIGASVFVCATKVEASTRNDIKRIIVEEAENSRVPTALALAVARIESDFDPNALSSAGARGVMQIMPATARGEFGIDEEELWNARLNIQLGISYLEQLFDQYGGRWDLALSHYNGGTLKGGSGSSAQPHAYTRKYVASVQNWQSRYAEQSKIWLVAGNIDDISGWRSARTKVKSTLVRPWRKRVNTRENLNKQPIRTVVRWTPAREPTKHILKPIFHSSSFEERLRWFRTSLDDFSDS